MTTIEVTFTPETTRDTARLGPIRRWFAEILRRHRQRVLLNQLSQLDPHLLKDIGVSPMDVIDVMEGRDSAALFSPRWDQTAPDARRK